MWYLTDNGKHINKGIGKMSSKEFKYTGQYWQTRAILHLIGQVHHALDSRVLVSDVAAWMGRSKQTARKHLRQWCEWGYLSEVKFKNRHEFQLTDATFNRYMSGAFKADYHAMLGRYTTSHLMRS